MLFKNYKYSKKVKHYKLGDKVLKNVIKYKNFKTIGSLLEQISDITTVTQFLTFILSATSSVNGCTSI